MPAPHQTIAISQLASAHAMNNADSYSSDFLVWWKDFWVSTPGMNPSPEAKAAAWAAWNAGRAREQAIWGNRSSGPSHKPAAVEALKGVLDEIEDYLEQRQDVRDGSDGPRANTEMSLLSDLRWWRDSAGMCSATQREGAADVD
jgi:hypothetical protein